ncbi:hypothetical protein H4R18_005738 [Coemansia javaensis]|uniref:Uncharacterized protein n=1 Tax=Coemansia javaensis TaxID=2761396 RepID=A0A9W8H0Q1_9FUNG|nr:hypothetical protein H4R18_005738 [Coemansia javaensis]
MEIATPDGQGRVTIAAMATRRWTSAESTALLAAVEQSWRQHGIIVWPEVAQSIPGRGPLPCRNRYWRLAKRGRPGGGGPAAARSGTSRLSGKYARWTPAEVERLRDLWSVHGNRWTLIATQIPGRSPRSCMGKIMHMVRVAMKQMRQRSAHGPSPPAPPPPAPPRPCPLAEPAHPPKRPPLRAWTAADSERLQELMVAQGTCAPGKLTKHFPGATYAQVYQAARRLEAGRAQGFRQWTPAERRRLIQLVHKHHPDWSAIAKNMPTPRTPEMCRLMYCGILAGPVTRRKRWTSADLDRLRRLVDLESRGELAPRLFCPDSSTALDDLPVPRDGMGQRLKRISGMLQRDTAAAAAAAATSAAAAPAQAPNRAPTDWRLIAMHMGALSATQCRIAYLKYCVPGSRPDDLYHGPWTREEDKALYVLYTQAKFRWRWIQKNLPRRRDACSVRLRYTGYIAPYVAMLRGCRGPDWDPLADDFEEVHYRCEIRAWYMARIVGYRPQDPYECPFDMGHRGHSQKTPAAAAAAAV